MFEISFESLSRPLSLLLQLALGFQFEVNRHAAHRNPRSGPVVADLSSGITPDARHGRGNSGFRDSANGVRVSTPCLGSRDALTCRGKGGTVFAWHLSTSTG